MESLPKPGHHAVMLCVRFSCFVPTKTTLLVVEENGVLVAREVGANLLLKGGLVKVLLSAKIPADGIVRFRTSEVDASALASESILVPRNRLQGCGRNVEPC